MAKEGSYALLRMPSGELRQVHINCRATIGQIGNLDHENLTLGKAGRSRWLGVRPANRGVAMNPNDHPHGGGEGHSPVGRKASCYSLGQECFWYPDPEEQESIFQTDSETQNEIIEFVERRHTECPDPLKKDLMSKLVC